MKNQAEAGKGSKRRPTQKEDYERGWDLIFNKNSFGIEDCKKSEEKKSEQDKSE